MEKIGAVGMLLTGIADAVLMALSFLEHSGVAQTDVAAAVLANSFWLVPLVSFAFGVFLGWWARGRTSETEEQAAHRRGAQDVLARVSVPQQRLLLKCLDSERGDAILVIDPTDLAARELEDEGLLRSVGVGSTGAIRCFLTADGREIAVRYERELRKSVKACKPI